MGFLSLFVCLFIASYIPLLELKKLEVRLPSTDKKKKKIYPQQKPVIYIQRRKIETA